jgi:mannose-6-phosphate isomerase-like protein (cupin superfamily)
VKIEVRPSSGNAEYYFREGCYITELSNTENDRELSIARVRVAPATSTRWHSLEGIAERYVILSGKGRVEVGADHVREVGEGDVVVIPAQTAQRIVNTGQGDLIFLALCTPRFDESAYRDLEGEGRNR